jgi:hypothetical protein
MNAAHQWWAKHGWWLPVPLGLVAIAIALASLIIEIPDRHWWATTLQLVGATVAFGGFSNAYVRAAYGESVWRQLLVWAKQFRGLLRRMWARLVGKSIDVVINAPPAGASAGMFAPTVTVSGRVLLNPSLPLDEQIAQLVTFVNNLAERLPELAEEIGRLDGRIDKVSADAAKAAADALSHMKSGIDKLTGRIERSQVLDLRWAIAGLFITVVGIALSY